MTSWYSNPHDISSYLLIFASSFVCLFVLFSTQNPCIWISNTHSIYSPKSSAKCFPSRVSSKNRHSLPRHQWIRRLTWEKWIVNRVFACCSYAACFFTSVSLKALIKNHLNLYPSCYLFSDKCYFLFSFLILIASNKCQGYPWHFIIFFFLSVLLLMPLLHLLQLLWLLSSIH